MQQLVREAQLRPWAEQSADPTIDRLLVTGGTGFVGGAVLAELMVSGYWRDTLIMVRAKDVGEGKKRIADSLQRFFPNVPVEHFLNEDQIVLGGLEDAGDLARDERTQHITHVIHCAAVTSFSAHPRIRAVNVDAGLGLVRALHDCAPIKRFVNVGTAWCIGMGGAPLVKEADDIVSAQHLVPYTESKLEFERRVRLEFPGLPFVTARPSIIVGHTRLGTQPSGSIYWVFRSAWLLGRFSCAFTDKVDVVPVDWVAHALVRLATKRKLKFSAYHLSAGRECASSIEQLDEAIASGSKWHDRAGYRQVSAPSLAAAVYAERSLFGDAKPKLLAKALCLYGKFAESGTVFDNRRTLAEGIQRPPAFYTYAGICAATAEATSIASQMEDDFKC